MAKKEKLGGSDPEYIASFFGADPEQIADPEAQEPQNPAPAPDPAPDPEPAGDLSTKYTDTSKDREKRNQRVNLIIQPSLYKLMRQQAKAEKISINELSIKAFVQYLEKAKK